MPINFSMNWNLKYKISLFKGYIDGSFWSTIESLQILNELKLYTKSKYDKQILEKVFNEANKHDREGSYDEVFGISCAFLWLRATYLGIHDKNTLHTLKWIRENLNDHEDREKALAYYTMFDTGIANDAEKKDLNNLLISQQEKLKNLSVIDLIVYLKCAVKVGINDIFITIIKVLQEKQKDDGVWVDLATTATAVATLLNVLKQKDFNHQCREILEPMIFKSIIYIQNTIETISDEIKYPWDNKASTSLKCIEAWLNFEILVDLPVHELIAALKSYSVGEEKKSSIETSLIILDELRTANRNIIQKNIKLSSDINKLSADAKKSKKLIIFNIFLKIISFLSIYILLSIIIYTSNKTPIKDIFKGAFIDEYVVHTVLLGLIAAYIGIVYTAIPIYKQKISGDDKND